MPTYEYSCISCKKSFDIQQRISEPHISSCPKCGGEVARQISLPTIHTVSKAKVAPRLSPNSSSMLGRSNLFTTPLDFPGRLLGVSTDKGKQVANKSTEPTSDSAPR